MNIVETNKAVLPRWDLTPYFPGLESPEFEGAIQKLTASIEQFELLLADLPPDAAASDAVAATYDAGTALANELTEQVVLLGSYIYGFLSTDSRDPAAQARNGEMQFVFARLSKAQTKFTAWIGCLDVEALISQSKLAAEHAFLVRISKIEATHMMSQAEEELAADLSLSGGNAFSRLHGDLASQVLASLENESGVIEEMPISEVRNLASNPDRAVRKRAFDAELAAWTFWSTPFASTLNGVTGEHGTLAKRRGWNEVIDESLFQNHVDRKTLDAMMGAARAAFPDLRRYLRAKAKALGVEQLAWYDLSAPLSSSDRAWSWDDAVTFVTEQFGSFSPRMRGLAQRAFDENWIDAGPRPGKSDGAFCMETRGEESRILANYNPAFDGVSTLAHELGHAYHNLCLADVTPLQRTATPMTLAETASTFCETILRKAAIANGTEADQLTILEGSLQDSVGIVIDISSRFLFEEAVFAKRSERQLSSEEFCALMLAAQQETYGDGVDSSTFHPYMWAVKGHYYSPSYAYYNYPYMFGLLFGLGLYAQYEADPETFRANYDELLASTGSADAAELAGRFGFDIQSSAFWEKSLDVIREDVDTFVALVERQTT